MKDEKIAQMSKSGANSISDSEKQQQFDELKDKHQKEIETYSLKEKEMENSLTKMKKENNLLSSQLIELNTKLSDLKQQLETSRNQTKELNTNGSSENDRLKQSNLNLAKSVSEMEGNLVEKSKENDKLKMDISQLKEQLSLQKALVKKLEEENKTEFAKGIEEKAKKIKELEILKQNLSNQLDQALKNNEKIISENLKIKKEFENLSKYQAIPANSSKDISTKIEQLNEKIKSQEKMLNEKDKELENKTKELLKNSSKQDNINIQNEMKNIKKINEEQFQVINSLNEQIKSEKEKNENLSLEFEEMKKKYDDLKTKNKEYKKLFENWGNSGNLNKGTSIAEVYQNDKFQTNLAEKIKELELENHHLNEINMNSESKINELSSELQNRKNENNKEVDKLKKIIENLKTELSDSKNINTTTDKNRKDINQKEFAEMNVFKEKIRHLEEEVKLRDKQIENLNDNVQKSVELMEKKDLKSRIEIDTSKKDIETLDKKLKETSSTLIHKTKKIAQMQDEYEAKIATITTECLKYQTEYEKLLNQSKEVTVISSEEVDSQSQNIKLKSELEELKKRLDNFQSLEKYDVDKLFGDLSNLKEENERMKAEQQANEQRLFESKISWAEENNNYRQEIEKLEQQIINTKLLFAQVSTERDQLISKNVELQKLLSKHSNQKK